VFTDPMTTTPPPGGPTVAGQAPLSAVLDELARRRPVLHSEADLQLVDSWREGLVTLKLTDPHVRGENP
jgi:hypothetical protein